jgi:acyl dehydratase
MLLLDGDVVGRAADLGRVTVTAKSVVGYLRTVGDERRLNAITPGAAILEAPPTFCLSLYTGMTPKVELPEDTFAMYGGHDIELYRPIRAGDVLHVQARITDVFEKSGRSGSLTVVVREVSMRDDSGAEVVRVTERQIVRLRRDLTGATE